MHCSGTFSGRALAFAFAALASTDTFAATTTIYKCFDSHLSLVYTDSPCKDGERMDINPGEADPVAVSRLQHARDMLDRAAAERLSDDRRAAALQGIAAMMRYRTEDDRAILDYAAASMLDFGYPLFSPSPRRHAARHRMPRYAQLHGFAPNPPYFVPGR